MTQSRTKSAPATLGEPTETQHRALAGERHHELLDMQLREDGTLWTKWLDGERFVILLDGEMDEFTYVWVGAAFHDHIRQMKDARDLRETQSDVRYAGAW